MCRLSNREVSFICINGAAAADAAALCCYCCCISFCYLDTVCGFTTEHLDLIHYNYTVRCCATCERVFVYKALRVAGRSALPPATLAQNEEWIGMTDMCSK